MKKVYSLVAVMILMTGCSYKNEAIELSSYQPHYLNKTTDDRNHISYLTVTDMRENKKSIGYVLVNDTIETKFYSYVNFADRYKDGLTQALKSANFNITDNPAHMNSKLEVSIKDIQIIYNDTDKFNENLHGKIVIEVKMTKAEKVNILTFTQKQGMWIKPSYTSKDVEPLLTTLFTDSIDDIVSKLSNK